MARELTGRHVLIITLTAFGVIIGVNVLLAVKAIGTFPGLEVANSYVASQTFDKERVAQQALGWTVTPHHDGTVLHVKIVDRQGQPVAAREVTADVGRPTSVAQDQTLTLVAQGGEFVAPLTLGSGNWIMHLSATAPDGTVFRQRLDLRAGS